MSKTTILTILAAVVFLVAVGLALFQLRDAGDREVVNRYLGSAFSFTYPLGYDIAEYPNGSIAIGTPTADGIEPAVDLTVAEGAPADYADFNAFVEQQLATLCAADGPGESLSCTGPFARTAVKNAQGENAGRYELTVTRTTGGVTSTFPLGPVYVYVLEPSDEETFTFRTLIVHHPLPAAAAGSMNAELLTHVNDSIQLGPERN